MNERRGDTLARDERDFLRSSDMKISLNYRVSFGSTRICLESVRAQPLTGGAGPPLARAVTGDVALAVMFETLSANRSRDCWRVAGESYLPATFLRRSRPKPVNMQTPVANIAKEAGSGVAVTTGAAVSTKDAVSPATARRYVASNVYVI